MGHRSILNLAVVLGHQGKYEAAEEEGREGGESRRRRVEKEKGREREGSRRRRVEKEEGRQRARYRDNVQVDALIYCSLRL
jgi:hypothetical protein